ncbi:hypothetical protein [Myxococcus sp. RHSTA-1-4]|uniref:hypothetical protein n=1 Tax=Myxococcus sp. RHSTA-1-4 TaxID=2874601 RepID=UPI001CBF274A|nr:hypothetical protein [Myxococcus sp. RHSTA-1-4]MBZ4422401.1 hypothetical protein [Myxococcus sp. RHSTA-1-4]
MGAMRKLAWGVLALCTACGGSRPAVKAEAGRGEGVGGSGKSEPVSHSTARRYVDEDLGFEIVRPTADWELDETNERTPEGLSIPVILRHNTSGAQVVLQVAPAVASPTQFAERLTEGLRQQPGFTTTDPAPIPLSEDAVGFDFQVGDTVLGRVAVREGRPGRVLMMLATWPAQASSDVTRSVDALIEGVRPLPGPGATQAMLPRGRWR